MEHVRHFLDYLIPGISLGTIYALIALGFTIIFRVTEIINFAQGEFVMLGAMCMATFHRTLGLPFPVAFLASVASVTMVGALVESLAIRPIRNASVVSLIIVTIGCSILIRGIAMFLWGKNALPWLEIGQGNPISLWGTLWVSPQTVWILAITLSVVLVSHLFFEHTFPGKAMTACAINQRAAHLVGIPVERMVLYSFALSAALGAVSGIVITLKFFPVYDMGVSLGLKGFCAAILGGLGNNVGAVLGGILLGLLESFGIGFLSRIMNISSGYKDVIALFVLVLVLVVRPAGLLGSTVSEKD
jgi:branched-chain amino acid transport system permease protein